MSLPVTCLVSCDSDNNPIGQGSSERISPRSHSLGMAGPNLNAGQSGSRSCTYSRVACRGSGDQQEGVERYLYYPHFIPAVSPESWNSVSLHCLTCKIGNKDTCLPGIARFKQTHMSLTGFKHHMDEKHYYLAKTHPDNNCKLASEGHSPKCTNTIKEMGERKKIEVTSLHLDPRA